MSAKSPSAENPEVTAKAITVRRARTSDVAGIRRLLDSYVHDRILLDKATVTLYEDIQEFWVAERDDNAELVGFGALHVMWEDLAEVRTLAVKPGLKGAGVGHQLLEKLLQTARWLGVRRVFCLTFEVDFFGMMSEEQRLALQDAVRMVEGPTAENPDSASRGGGR